LQHLDSQDGALQCYHYPLNGLPASRLLLPRSGLERSDFVQGPIATFAAIAQRRPVSERRAHRRRFI